MDHMHYLTNPIYFFFMREGGGGGGGCEGHVYILTFSNFNERSNFDSNAFGWGKKLTVFSETSISNHVINVSNYLDGIQT